MFEDTNKRSISDKWLSDVIYPALDKLNNAYFRMEHGCSDVVELLDPNLSIENVRYVNAGIFISSIKFILVNGKALFTLDEHTSISNKLEVIQAYYREYVVDRQYNDVLKQSVFVLLPSFDIIVKRLQQLHYELITALQDVLFIEGNVRMKKVKA